MAITFLRLLAMAGGMACFFLVSCQTSSTDQQLAPLISPTSAPVYKPLIPSEVEHKLPDPGFRINLALQDKSVMTVLKTLADLADFPLGFDDEAAAKARQRYLSLVAHEAPLDTLLNFCARAIDTPITWWPQEPLVWFGQQPPVAREKTKLRIWSLEMFLTEFQALQASELITHSGSPHKTNEAIAELSQALEQEKEKNPELPTVFQYLSEDPILLGLTISIQTEEIEEPSLSPWLLSLNEGEYDLETLKKNLQKDKKKPPPLTATQDFIRWIQQDKACEPFKESLEGALFDQWARDWLQFIEAHPELTQLSHSLSPEDLERWAVEIRENIFSLELLKNLPEPLTRLKIYRKFELYRKFEEYREKRKKRFENLTTPIDQFVQEYDLAFAQTKKKLTQSRKKENQQIRQYLTKRDSEAHQVAQLFDQAVGKPLHLRVLNHGGFILGPVTSTQTYVIDTILQRLHFPETFQADDWAYHYQLDQDLISQSLKTLVNNKFQLRTLDTILYQWALEARLTLAWVVNDLPALGQVLISRDNGLLPFKESIRDLSQKYSLASLRDEGNNCYWLGKQTTNHFKDPLPSRWRLLRLPTSLSEYSAAYLTDYLLSFFTPKRGFVSATPGNTLFLAVSRPDEEKLLTILSKIAQKGTLPGATIISKDKSAR